MLSESELTAIREHRGYPCVSILMPTHRTAPRNKQDPIRAKNLARKAIQRLESEFPKREVAPVVKNIKQLVGAVDWRYTLDGLALFASATQAHAVQMPFRVKPRLLIDETFAVRDLIYALHRAPRYRVLVLGHESRLFDAWTSVLEERRARPFPLAHRGPGGAAKLPGGKGINPSATRDEAERAYFQTVDSAVADLHKSDPLPLVLVGVERNLAFYREVTGHEGVIVGMLAGNHEKTAVSVLGKLVWPVFESGATLRRTEALVRLDKAVSVNRYASGIDQVWRAVAANQCQTLLVEKEFKYPADVGPEPDRLAPYTAKGAQAMDDTVDEAVTRVLNQGGEVYFYPCDDLAVHQKIAAVLRH